MNHRCQSESSVSLGECLADYARWVSRNFRAPCYLVGSALLRPGWRDVDVRLILPDALYQACGFGEPRQRHRNQAWLSCCRDWSALGKVMTGLPIDFQIQQQTFSEKNFHGPRELLADGSS